MSSITIVSLDSANYPQFKRNLVELYTLSFTEGEHAQHIPIEEVETSLDERMGIGFGFMAVETSNVVGVVLCLSLKYDPEFPFDKHKDINPAKTFTFPT